MRLSGQVVIVTGASQGIGEALARVFVREGGSVVLSSRNLEALERARERVGHAERTFAVTCDVRRREQIEHLVRATLDRFERVDVCINNAVLAGLRDAVHRMDMTYCRSMFETNVFGVVEMLQAFAPVMQRQGSGTFVNMSSIYGQVSKPMLGAYCGCKFALNALTTAARLELKKSGVRVMNVCAGHSKKPEQVAEAVLRGYLRGDTEVVFPRREHFKIKLNQIFPQLVEWEMGRRMHPTALDANTDH